MRQILNTAPAFVALWIAMLYSLEVSYFLTLLLAVPAAGFLTRLFIFQHDCGHGSFFPSRRANNLVGSILGVLTLTPYSYWRRAHAIHHATSGDLDRRGLGDVNTLTVEEYLALSPWGRLRYRVYRHPLVLFGFGPIYQFLIKHRLPFDAPRTWKREWLGVVWTNLALAAAIVGLCLAVGVERFLLVQVPITFVTGFLGVWLFYVQHQFEDTYWEKNPDWSFDAAGLEGSSFYDLPPFLHWFTGNIGYHHIHHLSSRIPNYYLPACAKAFPLLQETNRLSLRESVRCFGLALWDEGTRRLISFRQLKTMRSAG